MNIMFHAFPTRLSLRGGGLRISPKSQSLLQGGELGIFVSPRAFIKVESYIRRPAPRFALLVPRAYIGSILSSPSMKLWKRSFMFQKMPRVKQPSHSESRILDLKLAPKVRFVGQLGYVFPTECFLPIYKITSTNIKM